MMTIRRVRQFKKDAKREAKTTGEQALNALLDEVLLPLISGSVLQPKHKDHALTGNWTGCRDCHLKPDLVLIYELSDESLTLHRLGSHSELFR